MKICRWSPDGGANSGVQGFFILELKSLFSIVLLKFNKGTREAYHNHAFNAVTLWLKGSVIEHDVNYTTQKFKAGQFKYTSRKKFHKIEALDNNVYALSFRGPWIETWKEFKNDKIITLTHGRKEVVDF